MPLPSIVRRFLRLEDLLGIFWLALLSPISGDLFLDGGLSTVVLALAAIGCDRSGAAPSPRRAGIHARGGVGRPAAAGPPHRVIRVPRPFHGLP
jgi:hypothetical protein